MIIWKIPGIFLLVIKLIIIKKGGFWMDLDRLLVHDVMMAMINPTFQARSIVFKSVCGGGGGQTHPNTLDKQKKKEIRKS